jgi:hypothetical protein
MARKSKHTKKELTDWIIGKAKTAAGMRRNILAAQERSRDATLIGRMYFFSYDPKWKDILPMYDKFPMVFPIERYGDGFLGLNLHYLTLPEREALLGKLSEFANNKKLTPKTRLNLSYDLLQRTKGLANLSRPCIKRYLFDHVMSRFIEVTPDEWSYAVELPVEMWVFK